MQVHARARQEILSHILAPGSRRQVQRQGRRDGSASGGIKGRLGDRPDQRQQQRQRQHKQEEKGNCGEGQASQEHMEGLHEHDLRSEEGAMQQQHPMAHAHANSSSRDSVDSNDDAALGGDEVEGDEDLEGDGEARVASTQRLPVFRLDVELGDEQVVSGGGEEVRRARDYK